MLAALHVRCWARRIAATTLPPPADEAPSSLTFCFSEFARVTALNGRLPALNGPEGHNTANKLIKCSVNSSHTDYSKGPEGGGTGGAGGVLAFCLAALVRASCTLRVSMPRRSMASF